MRSNHEVSLLKEMKETLKLAIENLVGQEIRMLQLGRTHTPSFMLEELSVSIRESKREVRHLTEVLTQKEKLTLVKKMVRETVEEEIERTIQQRGNPCLRCVHLRYYDWKLNPYENFPVGTNRDLCK